MSGGGGTSGGGGGGTSPSPQVLPAAGGRFEVHQILKIAEFLGARVVELFVRLDRQLFLVTTGSRFKVLQIVEIAEGQLFLDLSFFVHLLGQFFLDDELLFRQFLFGQLLLVGELLFRQFLFGQLLFASLFLVPRLGVFKLVAVRAVSFRRELAQGVAEGLHELARIHDEGLGRGLIQAQDAGGLVGAVHDDHAGVVGDHHFADKSVLLFHQDDGHLAAFADVEAHLRAADADRRHRRVQCHRIGVRLRDLTADESEHAFQDRHRDRAFLGSGVVHHLVEHHRAVLGHGERRLVGKRDADRAAVARLERVALEDRGARLQHFLGAVGVGDRDRSLEAVNLPDGLRVGSRARLRDLYGFGPFGLGVSPDTLRSSGVDRVSHLRFSRSSDCGVPYLRGARDPTSRATSVRESRRVAAVRRFSPSNRKRASY